jgi:hypothetical protein
VVDLETELARCRLELNLAKEDNIKLMGIVRDPKKVEMVCEYIRSDRRHDAHRVDLLQCYENEIAELRYALHLVTDLKVSPTTIDFYCGKIFRDDVRTEAERITETALRIDGLAEGGCTVRISSDLGSLLIYHDEAGDSFCRNGVIEISELQTMRRFRGNQWLDAKFIRGTDAVMVIL